MVQREVSVNCVVAWVGWSSAIACAIVSLIYPDLGLAPTTVLFTGGAAVLHVRGFVHGLVEREVRAFELGRQAERSVRAVR